MICLAEQAASRPAYLLWFSCWYDGWGYWVWDLFWLSLSALPACWDPLLGWLGSAWACVCEHVCVCTCFSLCVHLRECFMCVCLCSMYVCVCVCVCTCALFMCVGVCVGRALKLTVSRQPEDIFMRFLTVDANQWILTWCSLRTLSCKTHRGNIFKFSFSSE